MQERLQTEPWSYSRTLTLLGGLKALHPRCSTHSLLGACFRKLNGIDMVLHIAAGTSVAREDCSQTETRLNWVWLYGRQMLTESVVLMQDVRETHRLTVGPPILPHGRSLIIDRHHTEPCPGRKRRWCFWICQLMRSQSVSVTVRMTGHVLWQCFPSRKQSGSRGRADGRTGWHNVFLSKSGCLYYCGTYWLSTGWRLTVILLHALDWHMQICIMRQ